MEVVYSYIENNLNFITVGSVDSEIYAILEGQIFDARFYFLLLLSASRVGRGKLVLRHSIPHFPLSSGGIACWVGEINAAVNLQLNQTEEMEILI